MEVRMHLKRISESWDPDNDSYSHTLHMVFAGCEFNFDVTAEVAAEVAMAAKTEAGEGFHPAPLASDEAEGSTELPLSDFKVAGPDEAPDLTPVPSVRGLQPVPRAVVRDTSAPEDADDAFNQG